MERRKVIKGIAAAVGIAWVSPRISDLGLDQTSMEKMSNHWSTNYRAYQDGPVEFRYALRPHGGYEPVAASRFATGMSQPLVASAQGQRSRMGLKVRIDQEDALVQECKRSADGSAWIVQLFGASGEDRKAGLTWADGRPIKVWRSNLSELPLKRIDTQVDVRAWDLITLRIET